MRRLNCLIINPILFPEQPMPAMGMAGAYDTALPNVNKSNQMIKEDVPGFSTRQSRIRLRCGIWPHSCPT